MQRANMYSDPADGSPVLIRLEPAVEVNVTGKVRGTDWLRVAQGDGTGGYLAAALLIDRYPVAETSGMYCVARHANVRSGPGVGYDKVGRLEPGAEVE